MIIENDINHEFLDCYILNDQPTTCGICGARTNFDELNNGLQIHECLNVECGYQFITSDESN